MVQVGKELQRSYGPTPCSRRATESRLPRTVSSLWISSSTETLQPPQLSCRSAWSPSQRKGASWCSDRLPVFQFVKEDIKGWQLIALSMYISTNWDHLFSAFSKEAAPEGIVSHTFGMSYGKLGASTAKAIALTAVELTCLYEFWQLQVTQLPKCRRLNSCCLPKWHSLHNLYMLLPLVWVSHTVNDVSKPSAAGFYCPSASIFSIETYFLIKREIHPLDTAEEHS